MDEYLLLRYRIEQHELFQLEELEERILDLLRTIDSLPQTVTAGVTKTPHDDTRSGQVTTIYQLLIATQYDPNATLIDNAIHFEQLSNIPTHEPRNGLQFTLFLLHRTDKTLYDQLFSNNTK